MKVSVRIITYNHEKYIAETLDSVLMQRTNFAYELVIGDDHSTDRTRDILLRYKNNYPEKVRLLLHDKNQGMIANNIQTLKACRGKYTALLDGDDYWTSPDKLQKQVDFLDNHPDIALCCHFVDIVDEDNRQLSSKKCESPLKYSLLGIEDLIEKGNFIPTSSIVRKREITDYIPEWFLQLHFSDWAQNILSAQFGKIGIINEVLGAYRKHPQGTWSALTSINNLRKTIDTFHIICAHFNLKKNPLFTKRLDRYYYKLAKNCSISGDFRQARTVALERFRDNPFAMRNNNLKILLIIIFPRFYYMLDRLQNIFRK